MVCTRTLSVVPLLIYCVWMKHFIVAGQPTDVFPATDHSLCPLFWATLWCDKTHAMSHHMLGVMMATDAAERSIAKQRFVYLVREPSHLCVFLNRLLFLAGDPRNPHQIPCISRREERHLVSTWTSASQERETHFLRGLLRMCAPPQNISVLQLHSIYHTRCLVRNPPSSLYDCQIPPPPTHPPTLCSWSHPLTWLQTNKNLCSPVIIYLVFLGVFPPSWSDCMAVKYFGICFIFVFGGRPPTLWSEIFHAHLRQRQQTESTDWWMQLLSLYWPQTAVMRL